MGDEALVWLCHEPILIWGERYLPTCVAVGRTKRPEALRADFLGI
jgi:hypothetical protein